MANDCKPMVRLDQLNQWMFESSPDCVKLLDMHGRLLDMNWNGRCSMEIDDFAQIAMRPWCSLWPEQSAETIEHSLATARGGAVGRFTAFCPTAKGSPRWWDVTVTPVRDESGRIHKILSISRDVTRLYKAEEAQRREASRLQFLFDSARVGEWEADTASGQVTTSIFHDCCFGYPEGAENWTLTKFMEHIHDADRPRIRAIVESITYDHKPWHFECRVVWPDNSVHWISAFGNSYGEPQGQSLKLVGTVQDITGRKRAEALAEGQRRALEMAVADAPLPDILDVLTRAAEEGSGEQLMATVLLLEEPGTYLRKASAPSIPRQFAHNMERVPVGPECGACGTAAYIRQPVHIKDIGTDSRCVAFRDIALAEGLRAVWSQPIISTQGKVLGTLAVYHNEIWEPSAEDHRLMELLSNTTALILDRHAEVVERRRAEQHLRRAAEELEEADRRKTEFLATLAHELRNPLAPILSGLEMLHVVGENPAAAVRVNGMMTRQATHMKHLVDDLLDVARISRGKLELRKQDLKVRDAVETAIEASLPLIHTKRHELKVEMGDGPLWLNADPTRIEQVVSNLLNNAAKYTPEGGKIILSVRRAADKVLISVTDNGIGLPAEALSEVFTMFAQIEQGVKRSQGGLGIGLTLVRRLVELHGGKVTAFSSGIGKGSCFSVELPLAEVKPVNGQAPVLQSPAVHQDKPLRILVVDDNRDAGEALANLLDLNGHITTTAIDGGSALRCVSQTTPDVVFLDLGLPDMDGYEVAEAIRAKPQLHDVMLVALTGWGSESDRARSAAAGFNHHLTKPASFADISNLLADRAA